MSTDVRYFTIILTINYGGSYSQMFFKIGVLNPIQIGLFGFSGLLTDGEGHPP